MSTAAIETRKLTVKIKRYDPERDAPPRWETFTVDSDPLDRVLDVIQNIKWNQDESIALRRSCAHGVCGSDAMRINGVNALACRILVRNLKGDTITLEPILGLPVIKDLIVDMKPFFDHYKSVMPFLINDDPAPTPERIQTPAQRARCDRHRSCPSWFAASRRGFSPRERRGAAKAGHRAFAWLGRRPWRASA